MAQGKNDGTVYINTLVDTKGFKKGVNNMQSQIGSLNGAFKKLGVTIASVFAIKQLIQFGKKAIELGSDLQEVQNVVDTVFTSMSDKVDEFAKSAAESAGLSETMAKRYTGTFGAMAKAFGFAEEESFMMSTALTQLAGDVASFYNITQDEAYTKLKSVFSGETETLKDLGVNVKFLPLSNMKINFQASSKGIDEYKKYLETIGFTPEQLSKNPSHKYILFDFAVSGNTLRYLKHTLNDVFGFWQNPNLITKEINQYTSKPLQDLFYHERFKNFSPVGKLKPREFENVFMQANVNTAVEYKSEMAKNIRKLFRFCVLDNLKENNNINPTRELTAIKRYETVSYVDRLAKKRMKEFFKNLNIQKTN